MLKPIIATGLLFLSHFTVAQGTLPTIEFIQDGQVIESRKMSNAEYQAYLDLKELEFQMEDIEVPLEDLEDEIEASAENIEEQVEAMVSQAIEHGVEHGIDQSLSGRLNISEHIDMTELHQKLAELKPKIDKVKLMARNIEIKVDEFKDLIHSDYHQSEIDQIRILDDGELESNFRFNYDG